MQLQLPERGYLSRSAMKPPEAVAASISSSRAPGTGAINTAHSAGTMSPTRIWTTSPGTTREAGMFQGNRVGGRWFPTVGLPARM